MSDIVDDLLHDFADAFTGRIVRPVDPDYPAAARTALCAGEPKLVLRPADTADVRRAVRFAAASGLPLAVRGGGHSAAALSTVDGGIVIDLGGLDAVTMIGERRVRVGGGARWGDVARVLTPHGLAISSGDTADVGVGGLTLSGGIGWMVRRDGLTLDHVRAIELVTADGVVTTADAEHHADLFWALRGGGGAFGVVTAFEFEARPLAEIGFATLTFPAGEAAKVVPAWAGFMHTAPDAISSMLTLANPLTGGREAPIELTLAVAGGGADAAAEALRGIGAVASIDVRRGAYADILHEGVEFPDTLRAAVRNGFIREENRGAAAVVAARMAAQEQPAAIVLHALGGAFGRTPADATAFAHRDAALMITTFGVAPAAAIGAVRNRLDDLWMPLEPLVDGVYANSLDGSSARVVADVYPDEVRARLGSVKAQYDPAGLFARTFAPAASTISAPGSPVS